MDLQAFGESGVVTSNIQSAASGLVRMNYLSGDTEVEEGRHHYHLRLREVSIPRGIIIGEVQSIGKVGKRHLPVCSCAAL